MRCPKCGYISFDHLESCKKCNKKISEASADLDGTVFAVATPMFLDLNYKESEVSLEEKEGVSAVEESPGDGAESVDLSFAEEEGDGEIVMDLGDDGEFDAVGLVEETDGPSLELDALEEAAPEDEITLDFGDEEKSTENGEEADDGLQLDFGEIDISDLAPPEEDGEELVAETLTLDEETSREPALAGGSPLASASVVPGSGLEDLQVEDLDLDTPSPLVAGSKAGDKLMPSVKTGTALDDFEIDLGELTLGDK